MGVPSSLPIMLTQVVAPLSISLQSSDMLVCIKLPSKISKSLCNIGIWLFAYAESLASRAAFVVKFLIDSSRNTNSFSAATSSIAASRRLPMSIVLFRLNFLPAAHCSGFVSKFFKRDLDKSIDGSLLLKL